MFKFWIFRLAGVPEDVWSDDAASYYYPYDYPPRCARIWEFITKNLAWLEKKYFIFSDDEPDEYSTKPVPIWLSLCLVVAYIVWGAFIFQVSEQRIEIFFRK